MLLFVVFAMCLLTLSKFLTSKSRVLVFFAGPGAIIGIRLSKQ
jgi:hypothetical protein